MTTHIDAALAGKKAIAITARFRHHRRGQNRTEMNWRKPRPERAHLHIKQKAIDCSSAPHDSTGPTIN